MTSSGILPIEMLRRLIAFDTTSHKSNLALIEFVRDYLDGLSVETRLIYDENRTKANLWATAGPNGVPGVVLSGHTDVVPVDHQPWSSEPYVLTERSGHLHGRGTADMKAFIAIVLSELPGFLDSQPRRPVHLAFTYDEEVGCLGAKRLLNAIAEDRPLPELAIVGEPTGLRIVNCHKGIRAFQTQVAGRAAHSGAPHLGASAISTAIRIVEFLHEIAADNCRHASKSLPFEPPWTTVNVGIIEGGTAVNIVPQECRLVWEYRPLPGEDPDEIRDRVQAFVDKELACGTDRIPSIRTVDLLQVPALEPCVPDSAAVRFARAIRKDAGPIEGASFTTEAGLYDAAGIPAVICGPGSVAQAHRPDEFLTLEQFQNGTQFVREIYARIAAGIAA